MIIPISTTALGAAALLLYWLVRRSKETTPIDWRGLLARLPLPMLALAASYGVYSFARLFVPDVVAVVQAAAFELTYIGLAVTRTLDATQRKRATLISVGAVVASIVYNTLAGWFHRQPQLLSGGDDISWLMFAILHGAPLAWVAYLVADLLLHSEAKPASRRPAQMRALIRRLARGWRSARASLAPLEAMLAQARADLAGVRASLAAQGEQLAQVLGETVEARGETADVRADLVRRDGELAQLRASLAHAASQEAQARADLATARDEARKLAHEAAVLRDRPAPMPPSRQQVIAYARGALASGRSLLSVAEELHYSESTLRTWLSAATNGHAVEA